MGKEITSPPNLLTHPSLSELTAFAIGAPLADERTHDIESHLTTCHACQSAIREVAPDPFMQTLSQSASTDERPGHRRIIPGYELKSRLGEGGAGVVYLARQPALDREVALKFLRSGSNASAVELRRWRREARALATLDHRHIVQIYEAGEQAGMPFLAMELVTGQTLADRLAESPLDAGEAAALIRDLADAMHYAHECGVIHRDLKPGNILLANEGALDSAKIADFGLSRWIDEEGQTCTRDPLGTPSYMAPEQVKASDQIRPATDIYGLGAIVYECLTGRPPFRGASAIETMQMVVNRDAIPIQRLRSKVPGDLDAICLRCLEKQTARRYATARDLRDDLQRFLDGRPVIARKPGKTRIAWMWVRRNPWAASFAALLSMAVTMGLMAMVWHQRSLAGQQDVARRHYSEARATIWEMLETAKSHSSLEIPKLSEMALAQAEQALVLFDRLAAEERTPAAALELAHVRLDVGTLYIALGDSERGEQEIAAALDTLQAMATTDQDAREILNSALAAQVKLSVARSEQGRFQDALNILQTAKKIGQDLLATMEPKSDVGAMNQLAWVQHSLGNNWLYIGEHENAMEEYTKAVGLRTRAFEIDPGNIELQRLLVESKLNLAQSQTTLGETAAADAMLREVIAELDDILDRDPSHQMLTTRATAYLNLSNLCAALEGPEAAVAACDQGIESARRAHDAEPSSAYSSDTLFRLHGNRALYQMSADRAAQAVDDWKTAIDMATNGDLRDYCQTMLVRCYVQAQLLDEAEQLANECGHRRLSTENQFRIAAAWGHLAYAVRENDAARSRQFGQRSLDWLQRVASKEPLSAHEERRSLAESSDDFLAARQLLGAVARTFYRR